MEVDSHPAIVSLICFKGSAGRSTRSTIHFSVLLVLPQIT